MKTKTTEVKTFIIEWICPCGGLIEGTGGPVLASNPPKIPHECNKCQEQHYSETAYPYTKFEYEDE